MKNKLFDIATLSDCVGCDESSYNQLGFIDIPGVIEGIIDIFSGGSGSGLPGDYANRVRSAHHWATERGVVECVDFNKIERLITQPGVWQGRTEAYLQGLKRQKMDTGSCQSVIQPGPGGWGGGGATLLPAGSGNLLLIVGAAALFFVMNKNKGRR